MESKRGKNVKIEVITSTLLVFLATFVEAENNTEFSMTSSNKLPNSHTFISGTKFCEYINQGRPIFKHLKLVNSSGVFPPSDCDGKVEKYLQTLESIDLSSSGLLEWRRTNDNALPNLKSIDLSYNEDFMMKSLTDEHFLFNLTQIKLRNIKEVTSKSMPRILESLPGLVTLDLSENNFKEFSFAENLRHSKNLLKIDLSNNPLKSIVLDRGIEQMKYLNISNCQLEFMSWQGRQFLTDDPALIEIDLSNNSLRVIPEFLVKIMKNAEYVNIKGNPIDIHSCSYYPLWKFLFLEDPNLITIEIDPQIKRASRPSLLDCPWSQCPFECDCHPEARLVNCSARGLKRVPEIGPSEAVVLHLQKNEIDDEGIRPLLEMSSWCRLRSINLDENRLGQIISESPKVIGQCPGGRLLPRLENLSLASNGIHSLTEVDWRLIQHVRSLDLSQNVLTQQTFLQESHQISYSLLEKLQISSNNFERVTMQLVKLMPFLEILNVSSNSIREFDLSLTSSMPDLATLDLSYNLIEQLTPRALYVRNQSPYENFFPYLKSLYLHGNQLTELNPFLWESLNVVTLFDNPWECSSRTVYNMQHFLWKNLNSGISVVLEQLVCQNGTLIKNLKFNSKNSGDIGTQSGKNALKFESKFFILLCCTVIFFVFLIILGTPLAKYCSYYARRTCSNKVKEPFADRIFDVFVYYCDRDAAFVNGEIIPEIKNFGCSVTHSEDFVFGSSRLDEFTNAVVSSKRMVAIISKNFFEDSGCIYGLRKGIEEEKYETRFKVACFYIEQDVQTPPHVSPVIRRFLECNRIRRHMATDMWSRNLKRFILGSQAIKSSISQSHSNSGFQSEESGIEMNNFGSSIERRSEN